MPGVSRSGATISMALFLGHRREEAARFSFLLATPITAGAALLKVPHLHGRRGPLGRAAGHDRGGGRRPAQHPLLLAYVRTRDYRPFAYYRWAFALAGVRRALGPEGIEAVQFLLTMLPVLTAAQMREADRRTIEAVCPAPC